jgi:MFS family permease
MSAVAAVRRPTVFYGWYIVAASVLVMTMCISGAGYLFGVFFPVLIARFGWTRAALSGANSAGLVVIAALGPFVGRLTDRYGPRAVMAVGGVLCGIGFTGLGLVGRQVAVLSLPPPLVQFYLCYLIFSLGVAAAAFVPINTVVANWFVRQRGLAMGITATGMSLGGLILVPLTGALIDQLGWRAAFGIVGGLMFTWVVPIAVFVMRRRPADCGLEPDGDAAGASTAGSVTLAPDLEPAGTDLSQALRSFSFWALGLAYAAYGLAQSSILVHAISLLIERGRSVQSARLVLSGVALSSTVAKIVIGYLADRVSVKLLVASCFALLALGSALLTVSRADVAWPFAVCSGVAMGGTASMAGPLIASRFGVAHFGAIFGGVHVFLLGASAASPVVSGYLYDVTGSYGLAFKIYAIAQVAGAILVLTVRRPVLDLSDRRLEKER